MLINICFDMHASTIECELSLTNFDKFVEDFEKWLYEVREDDKGKYLAVKESLNISYVDEYVVIRYLNEIYPNCNPKIKRLHFDIDELDPSIPTLNL